MGQLRAPIRKMQLSIVSLVLLSTLLGVFSEPQFEGYGPHMPSFRGYPAQAYRPQSQSPAPRLYFLESTTFTTTTSVITTNCAYSTAALGACSGRKRRGITADDQEFAIDAAPIQRVMLPKWPRWTTCARNASSCAKISLTTRAPSLLRTTTKSLRPRPPSPVIRVTASTLVTCTGV